MGLSFLGIFYFNKQRDTKKTNKGYEESLKKKKNNKGYQKEIIFFFLRKKNTCYPFPCPFFFNILIKE